MQQGHIKPQEKLHVSHQRTGGRDPCKAEGEGAMLERAGEGDSLIICMTWHKCHREKGGCACTR